MPQIVGTTQFRSSLDSDTATLYIGTDGRVGIKTSNPATDLEVRGTIQAEGLIVKKDTGTQLDSATIYGFNPRFNDWDSALSPA